MAPINRSSIEGDGQIAELRIFRGVLDDTERAAIEQVLLSTYGIG